MRLTLGKALPQLARYAVSGACETDPRVIDKINEARERIMTRPEKWKGKTQRFVFCVNRGCITLPREILTIEAVAVGAQPYRIRNQWYEVLDGGPGPVRAGNTYNGSLIDRGDGFVTFDDPAEATFIKVYADVPETPGARLLLQGFDEFGNRLRTFDDVAKDYVDGEYVNISNGSPAVSVNRIQLDGVQKPVTNGFVRLYAFTPGTPGIEPSDTTSFIEYAGTVAGQNPAFEGAVFSLDSYAWSGTADAVLHFVFIASLTDVPFYIEVYAADASTMLYAGELPSFPWTITVPGYGEFTVGFTSSNLLDGQRVHYQLRRTVVQGQEAVEQVQTAISILHPDDELPSYRRYYIPELDGNTASTRQMIVMATLRYLPVRRKSDFLNIEHIGALKNMLLCLNEEEKGNVTTALAYEGNCMRMLAGEVANFVGDTAQGSMQVDVEGFGAGDIHCPL